MQTKEIILSRGKAAIVDASDFDWLNQWKWCALYHKSFDQWYAVRNIWISDELRTLLYMHRFILDAPKGMEVDHRNGNGLDNTRFNIRICTRAQNQQNRLVKNKNTSGYKGVSWHKVNKQWQTSISVNGNRIYLGSYEDKDAAAARYLEAAKFYHGEFAKLK